MRGPRAAMPRAMASSVALSHAWRAIQDVERIQGPHRRSCPPRIPVRRITGARQCRCTVPRARSHFIAERARAVFAILVEVLPGGEVR